MFIAFVKQEAVGCDYSINCGVDLWYLKSNTMIDAYEEVKNKIIGDFFEDECVYEEGYWDESKIKEFTIFNVRDHLTFTTIEFYLEAIQREKDCTKAKKRRDEVDLYRKLKEKFE